MGNRDNNDEKELTAPEYEDFEVPKDFDDFKSKVSEKSERGGGLEDPMGLINPYNKNLFTWVIGVLVLTIIAISSGGIYLYKENMKAKDAEIERLLKEKEKNCKEELRNYIELQRELLRSMENNSNRDEKTERE